MLIKSSEIIPFLENNSLIYKKIVIELEFSFYMQINTDIRVSAMTNYKKINMKWLIRTNT